MWNSHAILYLWVILYHRLFLNRIPYQERDYSCRYLQSAHQEMCGLPFVDNLLDHKHINNPKFRVESEEEQTLNDEVYVNLDEQCPYPYSQ